MENSSSINQALCKEHKNSGIIYIKASENCKWILKCDECSLEEATTKDYLSINTIQNCNNDYIFKNWPPLKEQNVLTLIKSLYSNLSDPIIEIEKTFEALKNEISVKIDQKKKEAIEYVKQQAISREEIMNIYHQIAGINELRNHLKCENSDIEQQNESINLLIKEKYEQKDQNSIVLKQLLDRIKKYQSLLNLQDTALIKQSIQYQLEEFNILNSNKESIDQLKQIKKHINGLLNSRFNHLKPQFLQKFDDLFDKTGLIFQKLNPSEMSFFKPLNCSTLNDNDISVIEEITKELINKRENAAQVLQYQQLISSVMFGDIDQLFETATKFSYDDSHLIQLREDPLAKTISIQKNDALLFGGIYFRYNLTHNKKQTFRFKFNRKIGDYIMIGLINSKQLNKQFYLSDQGKVFGTHLKNQCSKIIKGRNFYDINENQIIEMRVDISSKYFQFTDFPLYSSINQLNQECLLNPEDTYYLAIHFGNNSSYTINIDLVYFKEE